MENTSEKNKAAGLFITSLLVFNIGFAVAKTMSGVLVNHIIEHFGLIGAQQGLMHSMINIGISAAIISAVVVRWKSRKTSMLVLSGLVTVSMIALTGLAGSFTILITVSVVLGVGLGWTDTYANSSIVDVDRAGSARHQSALQGCYAVGAIIAPIVIASLLLRISWQWVYLVLAPGILITVIIIIVVLKLVGRQIFVAEMESPKLTGKEILLFLRERRSLLLLATCMSYYAMQYGLFAWLVRYMSVQHGAEALGMAGITVMWSCTAIARFLTPRLPFDNIKMHTYGCFIAGGALLAGILSNDPLIMCIMVGVGALATGNSLPATINRCTVTYHGNSLLPTSAMYLSMQITGASVAPVLGAIAVYSMQGSMFVLIAAVIAAGFFGLAFLRLKPAVL